MKMNLRGISFIVCVISLSLLSACQKSKESQSILPEGIRLYDPDLERLANEGRLSLDERMKSIGDLMTVLKENYVLWNLKKALIGVDGAEISSQCLANEKKFPEPSGRNEFIDRLRICVANFKDTHLRIKQRVSSPKIFSVISYAMEVQGKLYISGIREDLLAYSAELNQIERTQFDAFVQKGTEIISIDGLSGKDSIAQLEAYISASSALAGHSEATARLFTRNFQLPKKKSLTIELRRDDKLLTINLPLFYEPTGEVESEAFLEKAGVDNYSKRSKGGFAPPSRGLNPESEVFDPEDLVTPVQFSAEPNSDLRFAMIGRLKANPATCLLQLTSFDVYSDEVYYTGGSSKVSFKEIYTSFLEYCSTPNTNLLIDLWSNGGGSSRLAMRILSAILPEQANITALAAYIVSPNAWPLLSALHSEAADSPISEKVFNSFKNAYIEKQAFTPWINESQESVVPTFTGSATLLISENCVSACDRFARAFKVAQRGHIVGHLTAGTGAGFFDSEDSFLAYKDPKNLYSVMTPNRLFAIVSGKIIEETVPFSPDLIAENKPVQPDIPYSLTLKDITDNFADLKALLAK